MVLSCILLEHDKNVGLKWYPRKGNIICKIQPRQQITLEAHWQKPRGRNTGTVSLVVSVIFGFESSLT